jgi:plastocyanin
LASTLAGDADPIGASMKYPTSRLHFVANRFVPPRAMVCAIVLGPFVGAALAFGAVTAEEANTVTIDSLEFAPKELTVPVGTTVKWFNHDDVPHTVVDKNKSFRSKTLDTNDAFSFTFSSAGTFSYFCSLHPQMVGKITVQ